jgi:hypothetical protein
VIEESVQHGWELVPFAPKGKVTALLAIKGSEIHVEIRERSMFRNTVTVFLEDLRKRFGFLTTRCAAGDSRSRRFITKIGFAPTWSDGEFEYFILNGPAFSKEQ